MQNEINNGIAYLRFICSLILHAKKYFKDMNFFLCDFSWNLPVWAHWEYNCYQVGDFQSQDCEWQICGSFVYAVKVPHQMYWNAWTLPSLYDIGCNIQCFPDHMQRKYHKSLKQEKTWKLSLWGLTSLK